MTRPRRRLPLQSRRTRPTRPTANPALRDLEWLVGLWDLELSNARFLPDPAATIESRCRIEWGEGGDVLVMHQGEKTAGAPYATWVIGRDEGRDEYVVLYCDDRRVSRVYRMQVVGGDWRIWREAPGFHQRFTGTVSEDGDTIRARWELSTDGQTWTHDFDLTYQRRRPRTVRAYRRRG